MAEPGNRPQSKTALQSLLLAHQHWSRGASHRAFVAEHIQQVTPESYVTQC